MSSPVQTPREPRSLPGTTPDTSSGGSSGTTSSVVVDSAAPRYVDRGVLGEGGMGEVRLVEDPRIGRDIAMKRIHPAQQHRANAATRFVREARIQGQLEHPAIVPVHELGKLDDGSAYFTMKRIHGTTLEEVIAMQRAGDTDALRSYSRHRLLAAFGTVCLAVHFAHTRGVIHRDLKPANIMLGEFGEVYVLDWGVATTARESNAVASVDDAGESGPARTAAGTVLGTPGYMAPEQQRGESADARSDIYSLGATLFEILALEPLHPARSSSDPIDGRPSLRPAGRDVPPELDEVCARATRFDPSARYQNARDLHDDVQRFRDGYRDLERRQEQARAHATRAREALGADVREASLEARSKAMAEVGSALALEPNDESARRILLELLTEPPRELPPDAAAYLAGRQREEQRVVAMVGGFSYLTFLLYIPLVLAMGVRDRSAFVWSNALFVLTIAVCFFFARRPPVDRRRAILPLAIASAAIGSMATMFGPLILMPQIAVMNTVGFILATRGGLRVLTVAIGALGVAVPLVMQLTGILPSSYAFHDGALVIVPRMHGFPPATTMAFLALSIAGHLVASCAFAARFRDALTKAETRQELQAWQLRQLAPERSSGHGA